MSIVDVAKQARVSVSTVSRVINHLPGVSQATQVRVRAAMQTMGYVPPLPERRRGPKGSRAGSLSSGLVVLLLDPRYGEAAEAAFALSHIQAGLQEAAAEHGAALCVGSLADPEFTLRSVGPLPVKAVFVLDGSPPPVTLAELAGVPVVQLTTPPLDRPRSWDTVSSDNVAIGRHAAEYLLARGHKRLCVLNSVYCWPAALERAMAFTACAHLAHHEVAFLQSPRCQRDGEAEGRSFCRRHRLSVAEGLSRQYLSLSPRPTGLFVTSDATTAVVYRVLLEAGVAIGKDVEIVSCNNDPDAIAALAPRPLTYDLQGRTIGRLGVELAAARASAGLRLPAVRLEVPAVPIPPG